MDELEQLYWVVFHFYRDLKPKIDNFALLPIWRDDSKSPATMKHSFDIIKKAIEFLHPRQTPMTTFDQPLYAILKRLQLHFPKSYGISEFEMILGALHIEMTILSTIGDWLEGSGWVNILCNAKVTTSRNQSFLTGHEAAKSKYAQQVTASILYAFIHRSY